MLSTSIGSPTKPSSNDFVGEIKGWWDNCPLFTRALMIICSVLGLLSLYFDIPDSLANIPTKTLGSFHITRLIFSPFVTYTLAELLVSFLVYLPIIAEQERSQGTFKVMVDFFVKNLEFNILFVIACYIISLVYGGAKEFAAYGLFGIFIMKIMEKFLDNPNDTISILGSNFHIPIKYYPVFLLALFCIVSDSLRFDIVVSCLVGFVHYKFLDIFYLEFFNDRKLNGWEESSYMTYIRNMPHYVNPGGNNPSALMNAYDHNVIREAGSPLDLNQNYGNTNQGGNYPGSFDVFGNSPSKLHNPDVEDLANDMEKQ